LSCTRLFAFSSTAVVFDSHLARFLCTAHFVYDHFAVLTPTMTLGAAGFSLRGSYLKKSVFYGAATAVGPT
jgi:hypothetical protein